MNPRTPLLAALALALPACGGGGNGSSGPPIPNPTDCATGIETPRAFPDLSFTSPVVMKQAPNDASRWFVVEQGGRIRSFENNADADTTVEFVDLTGRVHASGEAGLLGMAFHPDFANNGRVYLNFSELVGGGVRSITAEFTTMDDGQTLDPGSERVLLTVPKAFENHNGGNLEFGPDGYLYIGLGDGGGSGDRDGNAQNTQTLLGKMLRIDVDSRPGGAPYGIPSGAGGNPFAANPLCDDGSETQACPEIFATGLRNPWRWSFDRQTNELWAGDVGQNNWEEIDLIELGGNYGWDVREGAHCFEPASGCSTANLIDPIAEYDHGMGSSITGGYVYRGGQATDFAGRYVFGDYFGMIAALVPAGAGFQIEELVSQGCVPEGASGELRISSFAEDIDGELYLLDYGRGELLRLEFTE